MRFLVALSSYQAMIYSEVSCHPAGTLYLMFHFHHTLIAAHSPVPSYLAFVGQVVWPDHSRLGCPCCSKIAISLRMLIFLAFCLEMQKCHLCEYYLTFVWINWNFQFWKRCIWCFFVLTPSPPVITASSILDLLTSWFHNPGVTSWWFMSVRIVSWEKTPYRHLPW